MAVGSGLIERIGEAFGVARWDEPAADSFRQDFRARFGRSAPADLARYAALPGLAQVLAGAYTAQVIFPEQLRPAPADLAPGLDGEQLWLMTENQGVCVWTVPLDMGDRPPVIVAGDLPAENGGPRVYADTLDDFTAAWAWDLACLGRPTVLQAQAAELDAATEAYLGQHLRAGTPTWGWPARRTLRWHTDDGLEVLLWDGAGQCDWFISAPSVDVLRRWTERLLPLSDLQASLWSNEDTGQRLLADLRTGR